jgi:FAD/FMN-containing dehydrogenase/Fe-S oxidoreductase
VDSSAIRGRLRDDLRRQFRGELLLDDLSRLLYSTDASIFQVEPLAVAIPRDEADLQVLIRYAFDHAIPLIARGAGTGLAGESLGYGIIIDMSVHFRSIVEIGSDRVRVQPGVVLKDLNDALAKCGRRFAPDSASAASCTLGGMISTNASGSRAARHGTTREHLLALRVVWDDGSANEVQRENTVIPAGSRLAQIQSGLSDLLSIHAPLIQASRNRSPFNRCGYQLPSQPDLLHLLAGSEGTLAFFTEATLKTIPLAGGRAGVAFGFTSMDTALHAAELARELWPAACEILDRRLIVLARSQSTLVASVIPEKVEVVLVVEYERDTPNEAIEAARKLIEIVQHVHSLAIFARMASNEEEIEQLWSVRQAALPSLYAIGRGPRPVAFIEDIGIPPNLIGEFQFRTQSILKRHEVTASYLIHAATGQLHLRPFIDFDDAVDAAKLWPLAEEIHSLVIEMGGTVSAQHGTGIARTPWVERQYGRLYPVFKEVKNVFDPRNLLNPGKIVGPDPSRPAWPLRPSLHQTPEIVEKPPEELEEKPVVKLPLLVWKKDEMEQAIVACNSCGACRTRETSKRMCPTFHAIGTEPATPRAKANLFRDVLDRGPDGYSTSEIRKVADLCINCKMCATECPGRANIPKLMLEAKAANHSAHGLRRADWFLARIDGLAALGSRLPLLTNLLLSRPSVRWGMEKVLGLARRRTMPAFAYRSFLSRAKRRGWTNPPQEKGGVVYFVDTFANVFDPSIAEATIAVLKHHNIPFYVPLKQWGTGAAAHSQGDTVIAKDRLEANLKTLAEAAQQERTILCSEPTAALFLTRDALDLIDNPDVRLVAKHTKELTTYLWDLHQEGKLRTDFQPLDISLGHHVPCHIKALGSARGPALLSLIPQSKTSMIDVSCSGMAGPYGLKAASYAISLEAGRPMFEEMSRPKYLYGSTECSSCRMQIQEGTGKRTLHPIQYLAMAYGLMPSLAERLRRPIRSRLST